MPMTEPSFFEVDLRGGVGDFDEADKFDGYDLVDPEASAEPQGKALWERLFG
jgi:hypothetical protein